MSRFFGIATVSLSMVGEQGLWIKSYHHRRLENLGPDINFFFHNRSFLTRVIFLQLERMKHENLLLPLDDHHFDPNFSGVQRELMQLNKVNNFMMLTPYNISVSLN